MNWVIGPLAVLGVIGIGLFFRTMKAEDHSVLWKVCKYYFAYYTGLLLIGLAIIVMLGLATLMLIGTFIMWLIASVFWAIVARTHVTNSKSK